MNSVILSVVIGIGLSLITVFGDALVKHASLKPNLSGWIWLVLGALIYGVTAFGWFFVMRKLKLSTAGVVYSISIIVFLTLISVFYFKEKISLMEIVGISLAIISLIILTRFA